MYGKSYVPVSMFPLKYHCLGKCMDIKNMYLVISTFLVCIPFILPSLLHCATSLLPTCMCMVKQSVCVPVTGGSIKITIF